jgi:Cys-tRNA synthase (O-phospho-L-seryl-tRNA:Cys-tRNA synthase)
MNIVDAIFEIHKEGFEQVIRRLAKENPSAITGLYKDEVHPVVHEVVQKNVPKSETVDEKVQRLAKMYFKTLKLNHTKPIRKVHFYKFMADYFELQEEQLDELWESYYPIYETRMGDMGD